MSSTVTEKEQTRGIEQLDQLNCTIKILTVIALVKIVATIVLSCLSLWGYVPPPTILFGLADVVVTFLIIKAIDCCQQSVASHADLDLQKDYYAVRQPPVPAKE